MGRQSGDHSHGMHAGRQAWGPATPRARPPPPPIGSAMAQAEVPGMTRVTRPHTARAHGRGHTHKAPGTRRTPLNGNLPSMPYGPYELRPTACGRAAQGGCSWLQQLVAARTSTHFTYYRPVAPRSPDTIAISARTSAHMHKRARERNHRCSNTSAPPCPSMTATAEEWLQEGGVQAAPLAVDPGALLVGLAACVGQGGLGFRV